MLLFRLQNAIIPAENVTDADNVGRPAEESAFHYVAPNLLPEAF